MFKFTTLKEIKRNNIRKVLILIVKIYYQFGSNENLSTIALHNKYKRLMMFLNVSEIFKQT